MMSDSKETVVRIRPIKLIGVVFSVVTVILLLSSIAGKEWVEVKFIHGNERVITWGLWDICIDDVCEPGRTDWVRVCATFSIIALLLCLVTVLCGILGLVTRSLPRRRLLYLVAGIVVSLAALADLLSLIIYPVKFRETVTTFINVKRWDFDWTYGFGWGAFIFAVAAAVFFFLPIENQELQSKPY